MIAVLPTAVLREISVNALTGRALPDPVLIVAMADTLLRTLALLPDAQGSGGDALDLDVYVAEILEERDRANEELEELRKNATEEEDA